MSEIIRCLGMGIKSFSETSAQLHHLTRLSARDDLINLRLLEIKVCRNIFSYKKEYVSREK